MGLAITGKSQFEVKIGDRASVTKVVKIIDEYPLKIEEMKNYIGQVQSQIKVVKLELKKPFRYENELKDLVKKQSELNLKMEFKGQLEIENTHQNSDERLVTVNITESSLNTSDKHRSSKSKGLDLDI